ncbi:hypothetical protein FA13DRAFT_1750749 [Coprinellus micaceus]|uniref:BHLH domain-containing protein n=1 Tax=Coprinellus micaceus TaxID=71717 RepID=A0A4Y7R5V7_COPMI|nr:hypothetical protein FA13DRAFT_1750749 [Coprinellus micaceus]
METLLTPSESLAFQSFLTSVDSSQPPNDWASYASQFNPHSMRRDDDEISVDPLPPPPQNDTLTKATKDLMSLDAAGWNDGSISAHPDLQNHQQHLMYNPQMRHHPEQQQQPLLTQPLHPQHMYSSAHEPFPFLNQKGSFQHHNSPYSSSNMLMPSTTRNNNGQDSPHRNKGGSSQSPHPNGTTTSSSKPALLSPSQKKANHIQSEQKRRANIRRGYEALCETVPALREAIREEEEEARLNAAQAAAGLANSKGKAAGKKRASKKKDGEDGGLTSARDKIDGRAGPRSENVVLSKTIKSVIRLQNARSMLPPGHPCLLPLSPYPIWEREWKGGEGKFGDEEAEESEGEPAEGGR